jgi:hypothetical protein
MRVTVDKLLPTPSGLRMGCVVRYGEGGPVRFVDAELPWELITAEVLAAIYDHLNKTLDAEPLDEPLF